jgi:hypothetical protein
MCRIATFRCTLCHHTETIIDRTFNHSIGEGLRKQLRLYEEEDVTQCPLREIETYDVKDFCSECKEERYRELLKPKQ